MSGGSHDLRIGETIGAYRIRRVLGRGGAGTVYEVDGQGSTVALKVMHEQDPSGVGTKRFVREAALVQKLQHPHVVTLLGFGHTDGGLPYIAFESLHGQSLKTALRREGPFEVLDAGWIVLQILDALTAAHAMGVIHRDIKPANIFMCDGHDRPFAKVLDFGLAKALEGEGAEVATITDTGYRLGTPRYMSPEMARGQRVGEEGDLYALGLVFAEMLSGRPVVQAASQIDVLMAHANDKPLALDDSVLQSPFVEVIRRAVAKEIADRFPSAAAMKSELSRTLALHQQALDIASRFPDATADAATLMYVRSDPPADPLLHTEEMAPEVAQVARGPIVPAALAATMAFPEGFDVSTIPALAEATRSAPTLPMAAPPAAPITPPSSGRAQRNMWIVLAVVLVLIAAGIGAVGVMLR